MCISAPLLAITIFLFLLQLQAMLRYEGYSGSNVLQQMRDGGEGITTLNLSHSTETHAPSISMHLSYPQTSLNTPLWKKRDP
jgi:hypothetical protein